MNGPLLAHRFRVLEILDEAPSVVLSRAHDVASEREGWLLQIEGEGRSHTRTAVLARLRLFAARKLAREYTVDVQLVHEQSTYLLLRPPASAEPFASAVMAERWEEISEGLRDWCELGVAGTELSASRLWTDEGGAFFLPTAYCMPTDKGASGSIAWRQAERCRRQVETVGAELAQMGFEDRDLLAASSVGLTPGFVRTLERAPDDGTWIQLEGNANVAALSEALRAWCVDHRRPFLELSPYLEPPLSGRRSGAGSPVLFLDGAAEYSAFAEALFRLDRAGWLDGSETMILYRGDRPVDEALRLHLMSAKTTESWTIEDVLFATAEATPTEELGSPAARQLLQALQAAERPVSDAVLGGSLALDSGELVEALVSLFESGHVDLGFALAQELGRAPALVARARVGTEPAERHAEVRRLIASAVMTLPRRSQWGNAWLRIEAAHLCEPDEVGSLLRELAERSEKEGLPLLEYASYDRLLAWAEITVPRLEDRVRAAIRMAHEHRHRGELDRTDAILGEALEELQSRVEVPPERIGPLICDLVLERAHFSLYRSQFAEAEQQLRATLDRYRDHLPAVLRTRVYLDLSWALLQMGRTRESMDPCNLALRLVDSLRHPQLVARAYNQLGYAQYKESDYETSIRCFQRALVLRQQVGDDLAVARTYNNLSLSQRGLGQWHEAEHSLQESLRLKRAAGDHRGAAASLLNLGFVYLDQKDFDAARRCGVECLQLAEELQHPETEAEAYGLLGEVAAGRGELEQAQRYLRRDLDICEATGHEAERLATLRRLVHTLLQSEDLEEAAERLESARELLIRQPSRFEGAMLDRLEGELLLRAEAFDLAGDAFGSAARIFASLRRPADQVECLVRRALTEHRLQRSEAARQSLRELREVALSQELATLPEEVRELEAQLGPAVEDSESVAPGLLLQRAAEILANAESRSATEPRRWLSSVASGLGATQVLWLIQEVAAPARLVGSAAALRGIPAVLRDIDHDETGEGGICSRDEGWSALAASGRHWLCLQRDRPLDSNEVEFLRIVAAVGKIRDAQEEVGNHRATAESPLPSRPVVPESGAIIGRSAPIQRVLAMVDTVSATDVTVLLLGENGTGKDLVARAIHRQSSRREEPVVALNCASIPPSLLESELFGHEKGAFTSAHERRPGVFERAGRGTIFLDEIGEMPLPMQAKMLRVLQDRRFTRVGGSEVLQADVRVIAATNRKLLEEVREGRFRMDLYYRLNVVSIEIPPLRERSEDIEFLVEHFVEKHAAALGSPARRVSKEALSRLRDHPWPGNVRELENVVKNALVFTRDPVIRSENLPEQLLEGEVLDAGRSVEQAVQAMVASEDWSEDRPLLPRVELLLAHEAVAHLGNKTLAAKVLGITKPTLYSRLKRFEALYGAADAAAEKG